MEVQARGPQERDEAGRHHGVYGEDSGLQFTHKLVREAAMRFASGHVRWSEMEMLTITNASFGNEAEIVGDDLEPPRSQKGKIVMLSAAGVVEGKSLAVHMIGFASTLINRVCRARLQAETYALSSGVCTSTSRPHGETARSFPNSTFSGVSAHRHHAGIRRLGVR